MMLSMFKGQLVIDWPYNMDNNPMRIMSNERHSHKTAGPHVYETVDNVTA